MFANISDQQYHDLLAALHQRWRVPTRAVMVLLSSSGMSATEIGALLHYSPRTVRRWITRRQLYGVPGCPTGPAAAVLGWAARAWANASGRTHLGAAGYAEGVDHRPDHAGARVPQHQPAHHLPAHP